MSCDVPFWGIEAGQSRPLVPSVKHHGGKSTALKGDMQERRGIFCRLAIGRKRRRNAALTHGARDKEREGGRKARGL